MVTRREKAKWLVKLLKVIVVVYLLLILYQLIGNVYSRLSNTYEIQVPEEWNLIVVNRWNELPEDYEVELTELSNGQMGDSRIYPYLQEMFDAARTEDVYPVVREGYALLQKTYTVDFMTKKKVINKGIVLQYYVEDDHEPIIPKELFYQVQEEMARRASMNKSAVTRKKNQKSKFSSEYALTGLLLCGDCGQEYRCVTWSRNGKKKIVWRCSNRLTNGTKHCKKSETLEEVALNRAVMEAINRITRGDGDFVEDFRQNVIRVIGSYGGEQEPDEYDEKIKEKEEEITTLKEEQIEDRRKKKLADSYEQRLKDMDSFLEKQTCQIPEFDNDLVRRLIASIKVVSAEKLIIQFQSGIVMEQEIRYE